MLVITLSQVSVRPIRVKLRKVFVRQQEGDLCYCTMSVTIGSAPVCCTLLVLNDTDSPPQMVPRNNLCDSEN